LDLEIRHDAQGRPFLAVLRDGTDKTELDYEISISHSHGVSVAVCVSGVSGALNTKPESPSVVNHGSSVPANNKLAWLAFGLSVLSIVFWLLFVLRR
jgi:hypothetical protein